MLTEKDFFNIEKQAMQIYQSLELQIIEEIAKRITKVGYANTVVLNSIKIAQEMGLLYQDIILMVAKYNNTTYEKVSEIFSEAGAATIKFDDGIYTKAGLNPLPVNQSLGMLQLLNATVAKTSGNLQNLVLTTANTSQSQFYNAINNAYMEVSTGVKSYSQSIIDTIKDVSSQGAVITYPSGRNMSLESAVRMNIITGVNQTCGKLQEIRAGEVGWDLMELTAHSGARPEHAQWQGKIVSRSGKNKKYLNLSDIGYGEVTGFKGVNCRHDWYPYYQGSARTYTQEQLDSWENEKVKYNGKGYSKYEATQIQRRMEIQIRNDKKELSGLQGILKSANDNKLIEAAKTEFGRRSLIYKTHQNELNIFIQQTPFVKDNTRLYVGKQNKNISTQVANVTKIANKYNNSNIIGTKVNGVKITEIGEHIISRTYARDIAFEDVEDTLKNSIKYGKIRDNKTQQIKGRNCTIIINTETGKLVTVYGKKTKKD